MARRARPRDALAPDLRSSAGRQSSPETLPRRLPCANSQRSHSGRRQASLAADRPAAAHAPPDLPRTGAAVPPPPALSCFQMPARRDSRRQSSRILRGASEVAAAVIEERLTCATAQRLHMPNDNTMIASGKYVHDATINKSQRFIQHRCAGRLRVRRGAAKAGVAIVSISSETRRKVRLFFSQEVDREHAAL